MLPFFCSLRVQVFISGVIDNEPDFKDKLIGGLSQALTDVDPKDLPAIEFRYNRTPLYYPDKKPQKEVLSSDGILKLNWITKYNDILPSVVIVLFSFSTDWPINEWVRRESALFEYYSKVKNPLGARDIRVILTAFKTGSGFQDVFEERMASLKRRFQIDSRNVVVLTAVDMAPGSQSIKRFAKTIREFSTHFYITQGKRVRSIEKNLKANEYMLIARYNFKVSFLGEFLGQNSRALRHYKSAYSALMELYDDSPLRPHTASFTAAIEDTTSEQAKAVAEWVNYKVCLLLLRTGQLRDASMQLRTHVLAFKNPSHGTQLWSHFSWIADQYVIFAQLLDMCNINPSFIDADR